MASAAGNLHYKGETSKRKPVTIVSDGSGTLRTMELEWRTEDCAGGRSGGRYYYGERTIVRFTGTPGARTLSLDGASTADLGDGYTARVRIGGGGKLSRSGATWSGTWSARVRVRFEGERYYACRLKPVRWSASMLYRDRVAIGTFSFTDPGGQFTDEPGESPSYTAPDTPIVLERPGDGFATGFFFEVDNWNGSFANSEPLQPGTYTNATARDVPHMDFYGNGTGCGDDSHGDFTIERYRVRDGNLTAVAVSFSQACADNEPVTGRLDVRVMPPPFGALSRGGIQPVAHRVLAHGARFGELP